jgi:phosphatidate cytidylyltransferase
MPVEPGVPQSPIEPVPSNTAEAERRSRAGRNLPQAVAVGASLGALVIVALFVEKAGFVVLASVALSIAVWELANALATSGVRVPIVPVIVGGVAMIVGAYAGGPDTLVVALALTALAIFAWRLPAGPDGYRRDVTAAVFAVVYGPLLAGSAMLMLRPEDGPRRVAVFIVLVVCSDVGGYAVGVLFGRHPMAPSVSPKKSWEGFAGSVTACVVGGAVLVVTLLDGQWWQGAVIGVAAVCTATLGDLAESLLKRDLGIKDMGSLLPGHGGLMDRLDSILPTAPAVYVLLNAFFGS